MSQRRFGSRKKTISVATIFGALLAASGCGQSDANEDDPDVATVAGSVINGFGSTEEGSGYIRFSTSGGKSCTGTLMTNAWVLTARHCFNAVDVATPQAVKVRMGSQLTAAAQIVLHPSEDVALLRLTASFAMNGSKTLFQRNLYPSPTHTLTVGTLLTCRGFGINDWNNNTGGGTLRNADLPVLGVNFTKWFQHYDLAVSANSFGQFLAFGDSGGSCLYTMPDGEQVLAGVTSNVYNNFDGVFNGLVSAGTLRPWYSSTLPPPSLWSNHSSQRGAAGQYQHHFADVNGDGRGDWIQVSRTSNDGWVGLADATGNFQHWTNHSHHRGAVLDHEHHFADVNGDGRADWIQVSRASNDGWVGLADASGSFQHWSNHSPHRGAANDYRHHFADVNGDDRADWIQVSQTSNDGWVGLANASGNFQHWTNHSPHRGAVNDYQHYFADLSGDGRADWIQVSRTSNNGWVGLANASGDGGFHHWTHHFTDVGAVNDFQHYFADVNGDGRADWIQVSRTSNDGWVGLASSNGNIQRWTNHSARRGAVNAYQHYFADLNGDGRADWVQVSRASNDGWVGLASAQGNGSFQHWTYHSTDLGAVSDHEHSFADVNGDGRADWIQVSRASNDGWVGLMR